MTLKEWQNRSDLKTSWKEFLKTESGKGLKEVIVGLGTPVPTMPPKEIDFIHWNAILNARREGFFEAVRLLDVLSQDLSEKEELPAPWEKQTS